MLENIQAIVQWFEKGCDIPETEIINKKNDEKGFSILESNDICLLSKLPDISNKMLLDRTHKRLKKIKDPFAKKNFLLALISEFLRDGRKVIALKMISNEIDNETELFKLFKSDLLFHRVLYYFKVDKPCEALFDLYFALEKTKIQTIDIHIQILDEIKKYLNNNKLTGEHIVVKDCYEITFMKILKQYEKEIHRFMNEQEEERKQNKNVDNRELQKPFLNNDSNQCPSHQNRESKQNNYSNISNTNTTRYSSQTKQPKRLTYKNKLIVSGNYNNKISGKYFKQRLPPNDVCGDTYFSKHPYGIKSINNKEFQITYRVDNLKQEISVKQVLNEPIIDNIFNLSAILVTNLCKEYQINTVYQIFEIFGTIVNLKQFKDNTSGKLIIEYDNVDSPRYCISYLSQIVLPSVSEPHQYLEFRFYKSENQKGFRICKQNQIKTSRECYFWRTTGCRNYNCKFYHNRLAKGVDYQEWMRIENPSNLELTATRIITNNNYKQQHCAITLNQTEFRHLPENFNKNISILQN